MKASTGILAFTALTLVFISIGVCAQDSADAQAAQLAQALVKKHEAWISRLSTPRASIKADESGREKGAVSYRLYVTGLPTDKLYTVVEWPVTQADPVTIAEGVSLGKEGLVSCTGQLPGECNDPDPSPEEHGDG